jgi:osmotically-inducible protein OsmY
MRKYGKWVLTLGLLAATPGLTLAAGPKSKVDEKPAASSKKATKSENQRVAEDIAAAMRGKVQGDVNIEFKDGVATLSGSVADPRIKEKAAAIVSKVDGVSRVDNRLVVVEKNRSATAKAAEQSASKAGVVSANHEAAGQRARRVQQVNSEIEAPPISTNQEVAEQIGAALTSANLDGYDIKIRYQNGVAMLDGSVGTQAERATASQVVSSIPGVRSVANRLACAEEPARPAARQPGPPGQMGQPGQPGQMGPAGPYGQVPNAQGQYGPPPQYGPGPQGNIYAAGYRQPGAGPMPGQPMPGAGMSQMGSAMPMGPGAPPSYGHPGAGASQAVYNNPSLPDYAWPSYAQYPNSAAVNYPTQYSASAFPYIGPFYPYPQVPLGWRDATLRWDDGQWNLMFRSRTDKWWWFLNPNNW